jgi:hypothetical protein
MMSLKEQVHKVCVDFLNEKIKSITTAIKEIQVASFEETKSSVGDKYETGRAMAQLELEKYGAQLHEFQRMMEVLSTLNPTFKSITPSLGSLIVTDLGNFYLSVSVGSLTIDNQLCYGISPQSPIGKTLMSLKLGDEFQMRNKIGKILSIE